MIRNKLYLLTGFLLTALLMVSCAVKELDEISDNEDLTKRNHTIIVFMPWSSNLLPYFQQNINDIAKAIKDNQLIDSRFIVIQSISPTETEMTELYYTNDGCQRKKLLSYPYAKFTRQETITAMLNDVRRLSSTPYYSLIISSHGMGWLPISATADNGRSSMRAYMHYENTEEPLTRWFGGIISDYQIETTTLAQAIEAADMHMNYILFDNCYMSSVEVAYDLKEVTDYIVASPTEILIYGFPYYQCTQYLTEIANYASLCDSFIRFYETYQYPSGTIAVTDCRELENLAELYKKIYQEYSPINYKGSQIMDGYSPTVFYDLGDFVTQVCKDEGLLKVFNKQMNKTVPYKGHTARFYSSVSKQYYPICSYSGLTTSAPSRSDYMRYYQTTAWYQATH